MWKAEMNTLPEITNIEVELSDHYGKFCVSFEHDGMRYHVWIDEKTGTIKPLYGGKAVLYRNLPKDQNPPEKTVYLDADAKANLPLIAAMMKAIVDGELYRKAYKVAVMKELDELRIRQDEKVRAAGPLLLEACRDALSYLTATVNKLEATIKLAEGEDVE
jgi:hypothetical protein